MAEFSTTWTDGVVADYEKFDINQDGVITPKECLKAGESGVVRGSTVSAPPPSPSRSGSPAAPTTPVSAPSGRGCGQPGRRAGER